MKKRILALVLVLTFVIGSNAFAYRWVGDGVTWHVYNDETNEQLKNILLDTGDNVYYIDANGIMVTGWWKNPTTNKYYFFDNNIDRNLGAMAFGLHTIDGYYYYFGDDGSLQTADAAGNYKNVYMDFWADKNGYLYNNNVLMRDVSVNKSDYYTDTTYYTNPFFNNYVFSLYGTTINPTAITKEETTNKGGSKIITNQANFSKTREDGTKKDAGTGASGGDDYIVDAYGHVIAPDHTGTIKNSEIYGPANAGRQ